MPTYIEAPSGSGGEPEDFAVIIGQKTNNANLDTATTKDMDSEEVRLGAQLFTGGKIAADHWQITPVSGLVVAVGNAAKNDQAIVVGSQNQGAYHVRRNSGQVRLTVHQAVSERVTEIYLVVQDNQYDGQGQGSARIIMAQAVSQTDPLGPDPDWDAYVLLGRVRVPPGITNVTDDLITNYPVAGDEFTDSNQQLAQPVFTVPKAQVLDFAHTHPPAELSPAPASSGVLFAWYTGWQGGYDTTAIIPLNGRGQLAGVDANSRSRVLQTTDGFGTDHTAGFTTVTEFFDAWRADRIIELQLVIFTVGPRIQDEIYLNSSTTSIETTIQAPSVQTYLEPASLVGGTNQPTFFFFGGVASRPTGSSVSPYQHVPWTVRFDPANNRIEGFSSSTGQTTEERDMFVPTSGTANSVRRIQVNVHYRR